MRFFLELDDRGRDLTWCSSSAFRFFRASNSRSAAVSFGFRPGLRDASPSRPCEANCARDAAAFSPWS